MNEANKRGDLEEAKREFYEALADPDPLVQRIARNRLMELFPSTVYASTHSTLYHRANCIATTHGIMRSHIIELRDWVEAEASGYQPCEHCRPPRIRPRQVE
jgi:hypothetical protein